MSMNDTALRLINEYGVALTLARKSPGTVNPVTGLPASSTTATLSIYGVIQDDEKNLDGMTKTYMVAASVAPLIGVTVTDADGTFAVGKIYTASFKGAAVYYLIGLLK